MDGESEGASQLGILSLPGGPGEWRGAITPLIIPLYDGGELQLGSGVQGLTSQSQQIMKAFLSDQRGWVGGAGAEAKAGIGSKYREEGVGPAAPPPLWKPVSLCFVAEEFGSQ